MQTTQVPHAHYGVNFKNSFAQAREDKFFLFFYENNIFLFLTHIYHSFKLIEKYKISKVIH